MKNRAAALPSHNDGAEERECTSGHGLKRLEEVFKKFYRNLFVLRVGIPAPQIQTTGGQALLVLTNEVRNCTFQMMIGNASDRDGVNIELVKTGGYEF